MFRVTKGRNALLVGGHELEDAVGIPEAKDDPHTKK